MAGLQEWDYFHGIAAVKRMQSMYHGTLVAQGAFSIYYRDALIEVGGWPECVGEDIVLTWALLKQGLSHRLRRGRGRLHQRPHFLSPVRPPAPPLGARAGRGAQHHEALLFKPRLSTMFIWWNVLFLPMDLVFTFVFIPGVVLACFGYYWIAGPMTLLTLPLAALWNLVIFRIQQRMFRRPGASRPPQLQGFARSISVGYAVLMQPVSLWGYISEIVGRKKKWGTK